MKITPVILCGGSGTRLWPLSRKDHPKQYLSFVGDKTMLQETILRLRGLDNITDPIIVCNSDHRFLVAEQCQQIDITNATILLEPVAKNTAPAIVAAALQSLKKTDNASLLILSADHVIQDVDALHTAINIANQQVLNNKLTTFGILPTCANTEYGYIKLNQESINGVYKVDKFIEKPDFKKAKKYLEHGDYLWNSGMFMFKAKVLISELTIHAPEIVISVSKAINNAEYDLDFIRLSKNDFELSDFEIKKYIKKKKISYTVDTLKYFKKNSDSTLFFILGTDAFSIINSWHKWNEILNYCHLLLIERDEKDSSIKKMPPEVQEFFKANITNNINNLKKNKYGKIYLISMPILDESSSKIRDRSVKNLDIKDLLPKTINDYINHNHLYKSPGHNK